VPLSHSATSFLQSILVSCANPLRNEERHETMSIIKYDLQPTSVTIHQCGQRVFPLLMIVRTVKHRYSILDYTFFPPHVLSNLSDAEEPAVRLIGRDQS
jgi:hypothetical protein